MNNIGRTFRIVSIVALLLAGVPGLSHAGWWSERKPVKQVVNTVKAAPKKAVAKASTAPAAIQAQVEDMVEKLNAIHTQVEQSRPLANAIKDGKMINDLQEVLTFLNETRADYERFANSGVHGFSREVSGLLYDVGDIANIMNVGDNMGSRLSKAEDLIGKMPPQFMYLMHEAFGPTVVDLREQLFQLASRIEFMRGLPRADELMSSPEQYQASLCPIVKDKNTQVSYQVVKARLATLKITLDYVNSMTPDDLNVSAMVVGGGGATVSKYPAKYITQTLKTLADTMAQRLDNIHGIAGAVCE